MNLEDKNAEKSKIKEIFRIDTAHTKFSKLEGAINEETEESTLTPKKSFRDIK